MTKATEQGPQCTQWVRPGACALLREPSCQRSASFPCNGLALLSQVKIFPVFPSQTSDKRLQEVFLEETWQDVSHSPLRERLDVLRPMPTRQRPSPEPFWEHKQEPAGLDSWAFSAGRTAA